MSKDSNTKMVADGRNIISILDGMPKEGRELMSAIFGAYLDGWMARERPRTPASRYARGPNPRAGQRVKTAREGG